MQNAMREKNVTKARRTKVMIDLTIVLSVLVFGYVSLLVLTFATQ